jgi:hypothetical protein
MPWWQVSQRLKYTKLEFYLLFYMGMKLDLSWLGKNTETVWEQDAKENIWTSEGWSDWRLEKFVQ